MPTCFGINLNFHNKNEMLWAPFYYMISPLSKISEGDVYKLENYYADLFNTKDYFKSWQNNINGSLLLISSEYLFLDGFYKYFLMNEIKDYRNLRINNLLTNLRFNCFDMSHISEARKRIKILIKDYGSTFERLKKTYLLSDRANLKDRFSYSFEDLINIIN